MGVHVGSSDLNPEAGGHRDEESGESREDESASLRLQMIHVDKVVGSSLMAFEPLKS